MEYGRGGRVGSGLRDTVMWAGKMIVPDILDYPERQVALAHHGQVIQEFLTQDVH